MSEKILTPHMFYAHLLAEGGNPLMVDRLIVTSRINSLLIDDMSFRMSMTPDVFISLILGDFFDTIITQVEEHMVSETGISSEEFIKQLSAEIAEILSTKDKRDKREKK